MESKVNEKNLGKTIIEYINNLQNTKEGKNIFSKA